MRDHPGKGWIRGGENPENELVLQLISINQQLKEQKEFLSQSKFLRKRTVHKIRENINEINYEKIELEIIGVTSSQRQSGAYYLILGDSHKNRRVPIIIGTFEAQAIQIALENIEPSRPLTWDLFGKFIEHSGFSIREIIIDKEQGDVFFAKLVISDGLSEIEIDSRTSDAVAIAIRCKVPIMRVKNIFELKSISVENKK